MAIINTTGTLCASTATTGCQIPLSGKAQWVYLSVYAQTYGLFAQSTASSGSGTGIGLAFATGDTYVFQFQPGEAKYWYHVATAASEFHLMEVF
jgi:hypothetical protein